jgi:hypothetical protein
MSADIGAGERSLSELSGDAAYLREDIFIAYSAARLRSHAVSRRPPDVSVADSCCVQSFAPAPKPSLKNAG